MAEETNDLSKICRVCLKEGVMMSIFKVRVSKKLMACASIQVWPNDGLPAQICNKCSAKLHIAFQFRQLCEKSDAHLRHMAKKAQLQATSEQNLQQTINEHGLRKHKQLQKLKLEEQQLQPPSIEVEAATQQIIDMEGLRLGLNPAPQIVSSNCVYVECTPTVAESSATPSEEISYAELVTEGGKGGLPVNGYTATMHLYHENGTTNSYTISGALAAPTESTIIQQHISSILQASQERAITLSTSSEFIDSDLLVLPPQDIQIVDTQTICSLQTVQTEEPENCDEDVKMPPMDAPIESKDDSSLDVSSLTAKTKPPPCSVCGKVFTTTAKLTRHMRIHSDARPYKCETCGKGFQHLSNYKMHMRMHSDERPYSCSVCGRGCRQQQDLEKHMRTHTGERPHKCTVCPKAFSTSSNLTAHLRIHSGEKPYVCCVCQKAFCQSSELTKHMRKHTGEKSHICDICNKGFNGSSTLIIHRRSHTGERPYVCHICNKAFIQSSTMHMHIRRHKKASASSVDASKDLTLAVDNCESVLIEEPL